MNNDLISAAEHMDQAIDRLFASVKQMPPLGVMIVEPIVAVIVPLVERLRKVAKILETN